MKKIYNSIEDNRLVEMFKDGDSNAFGVIVVRYRSVIYGYISGILKDTILADDIMQDTFIKAMVSIRSGGYKEQHSLKQWLMMIARNLCINFFRSNSKADKLFLRESDVLVLDDSENSEERIIKRETDTMIHYLLDRLPTEQRNVVILRFFYNCNFKEIAFITGASLNTALGRMRYSLLNLRKLYLS